MLQKLSHKLPPNVLDELVDVVREFNITNPFRLIHFLAQVSHESGHFRYTRENLNYSAEALLRVFPKYFDKGQAQLYARKPEAIANIVYENRMGNGNRNSGDGWRYRGRGFLQVTGKHNYKAFGDFIGVDLVANPDLVATKYPLTSAGWFFEKNKLWLIADKGIGKDVVKQISYRVNGGYNGLQDRYNKTDFFSNILI